MTGPHCSGTDELYDVCDGTVFGDNPIFRDSPNSLQVILYYDEFTINPISPVNTKLKIGECIWGLGKVLIMFILYIAIIYVNKIVSP